MNNYINGIKIQNWVCWCIWPMLLCTLLVFPSFFFGYNVMLKNMGAVFIGVSMLALVMYYYKNRYLEIPQKVPRLLYSLLLIYVLCHIVYGAFLDKSCVPLTFWGNVDYVPAFLLPLFLKMGMRKENMLWLLKILTYFSLLTIPMYLVGYTYALYIGWTLFFPLVFAKFLPGKVATALIITGVFYIVLCWDQGARTPVIRTVIAFLIMAYTYFKPLIHRRLVNIAAIVIIAIPFYYFSLYLTTGFSVFNSELSVHSSSLGNNAADTRTFIYEEVLDDLKHSNTIWLGKGINGRYYSPYFSRNMGDNENRSNPEVGLLSYLLKGGVVYTVIIFLLFFFAIIRTLSFKDNIMAQIFGMLILQHFFLLFIENIPQYTMYNFVIWCVMGFAFSPELCEIERVEINNCFLRQG